MKEDKQHKRMRKIEEAILAEQPFAKARLVPDLIFVALFLLGIILAGAAIRLYDKTMISWVPLAVIWVITGLLFIPLTRRLFKEYPVRTTKFLMEWALNACAFGGIMMYLLLKLNLSFPSGEKETYKVEILNTGRISRNKMACKRSYATVEIKGMKKKLLFSCGFSFEGYRSVTVTLRQGLLGFDIIENKIVNKE